LTPVLKMLIEQSSMPLQAIESDFAVTRRGFLPVVFISGLMRSIAIRN